MVRCRQRSHLSPRLMRLPFLSSVNPRIATVAVHDVLMATIAFELALQVRYLFTEVQPIGFLWPGTLVFAAVSAVVFWRVGLYRGVWHYASLNDLIAILRASTFTVAAFLPVLFVFNRLEAVLRSSLPILWVLLIVLLTVPRFLYRALKDGPCPRAHRSSRRRAISAVPRPHAEVQYAEVQWDRSRFPRTRKQRIATTQRRRYRTRCARSSARGVVVGEVAASLFVESKGRR